MPSIALPVSLRGQLLSGSRFNPISLFSAGEQGIWLDPSDLTTMFTDRAGTTPVTTPGQTVGKRLDKSGRGNHAVAPTDAARPTYGIEPKTGRRNLLEQTEEFNNAYWTKTSATIIPDSDGIADLLYPSTSGTLRGIERTIGGVSSTPYTTSIEAKAAGLNFLYLYGAQGNVVAYFNLSTGVIGTVGSGLTATITDVGSGYYRCSVTQTVTTRFVYAGGCDANGSTQATASGTNGILIRKAQLEASATATAYQRVGTAFDVTEAGVPTVHYVQYDGTDDSFSTSSIDFSATDKMSVFAGVRKLSDAAQGVLAELSATIVSNNGSFLLAAPDGATATFGFDSKGTTQVDAVASSLTAPITRLVTGLADIAGDTTTIRINGVQADQDTGDQGTGNYGNYPLFIGRRNNATLPFNGRDYGILVVGKAVTPTEITNTESYLAANTSGVSI